MDISGITQTPNAAANAASANQAVAQPAGRRSQAVDEPVRIPAVENIDLRRSEEDRMNDVRRIIKGEQFKKQYFAVTDRVFTLFKDSSGQIITRFTSLRDGSVTYIPEPEILTLEDKDRYLGVDV